MSQEKISAVIIDLSIKRKFTNPINSDRVFKKNALFWFIFRSSDLFKIEPEINKCFKHAFRIAWIYPYTLDNKKRIKDIYFIFACYLGDSYFFNKDPIREKHIWKDVEWGQREKNYNSLGKDPGTVWIKIIDDGKGKTIKHELFSPLEIISKIRLSSLLTKKDILLLITNNFKKINGIKIQNIQ